MSKLLDPTTAIAAFEVKAALQRRFGERLAAVYVFGSRARGDHRDDSDLDLAVLLRHPSDDLGAIDRELVDIAYPVEIAHGVHIQPWALPAEAGTGGGRAKLAETVRHEGVRL